MTQRLRRGWAIRGVAVLTLAAAVFLPYARAANGLQPSLTQFLLSFLYLSDHRKLAPVLLALGLALVMTTVWPLARPVASATFCVAGLWGILMLAIPLGYAHVRPAAGYWVGQTLLLTLGVLLPASQRRSITQRRASADSD